MNQIALDKLYNRKQQEVLRRYYKERPFLLINHGAIRTGKTILDNDIFLSELTRIRCHAQEHGVVDPQYILAAASLGSVEKNVLAELKRKYGIKVRMDKYNRFRLLDVQVCCTGHDDIGQLSTITGMTSYGAYINEAALARKEVFAQIMKRCSADAAFSASIIADTNPREPTHWLKTEYIDAADGRRIEAFQWKLDDNNFLSKDYRANIIATTPSGVFYKRDIRGEWTTPEGIVYEDFDETIHVVTELPRITTYFAGVDWGYEHKGSIGLFGIGEDGIVYLVREISKKHQLIDWWVAQALSLVKEYGYGIPFFCDSARPEHLAAFTNAGIWAINADKSVEDGVEFIAKMIRSKYFKVYKPGMTDFLSEIYCYRWDPKTGMPIKVNDDVMDMTRYALYTKLRRDTRYAAQFQLAQPRRSVPAGIRNRAPLYIPR